jgi:DNA-binding NtrC family response regulator
MPKMSGKDCLMAMRRICPSVSVLIVTGYSPSEEFQAEIQPFVKGFLPKPFNMAQLVNHVRSILNDEGSIMA